MTKLFLSVIIYSNVLKCSINNLVLVVSYLFVKYDSLEKFAIANQSELEKDIYATGFYKNKAKNLIACSKMLLEKFDGIVPENMEDLISLPGVGRKSANVVMLEAFKNPQGIAVDTHAKRISNKIGLSNKTEPEKIEEDLLKSVIRISTTNSFVVKSSFSKITLHIGGSLISSSKSRFVLDLFCVSMLIFNIS